jgi:DNA repair ATPase RecN
VNQKGVWEIFDSDLDRLKTDYLLRKDRKNHLVQLLKDKNMRIERLRAEGILLEQVRILLQNTAEHARDQAKQQIEMIVTHALQFIFGSDIAFRIQMVNIRGRTEAEFLIVSRYGDFTVENQPEEARGGGIVDVVSLALRFALLQSYQPALSGPLVLDEPAKHVSEEFMTNVGDFLKHISQVFQRQVIMITHNSYLAEIADQSYRIEMRTDKSIAISLSTPPPSLDMISEKL